MIRSSSSLLEATKRNYNKSGDEEHRVPLPLRSNKKKLQLRGAAEEVK
ncbi:MAG: hypothetical protein N3F04_07600 [Candidatus Nezhaarchaeota archaeon]|nr:hypothetical protein [Candidatus Nezhaarchaeota archaeon]